MDEVVCAIPKGERELEFEAFKYGAVFQGDEFDVLGRYRAAAKAFNADIVMRITADCPLLCSDLCSAMLKWFLHWLDAGEEYEYASNVYPERRVPKGYDCEIFTMEVLRRAAREASPDQREHVTTWMNENISVMNFVAPFRMDGRLTLDTWDDYRTICAAFGDIADEHLRVVGSSGNSISSSFGTRSLSQH